MSININKVKKFVKDQVTATKLVTKDLISFYKENKGSIQEALAPKEIGTTTFGQHDVMLYENEFIFACTGQRAIPNALVAKTGVGMIIFVNQAWSKSSHMVKEAILAHELGHIQMKHLEVKYPFEGYINMVKRSLDDYNQVEKELEADMVAMEAGHAEGLWDFLAEARNWTHKYFHHNSEELDERFEIVCEWLNINN